MLTKEIVRIVKAKKGARELFNDILVSVWSKEYYKPSQYKDAVTKALIIAVPELKPELDASPITNGTANAVASKLE